MFLTNLYRPVAIFYTFFLPVPRGNQEYREFHKYQLIRLISVTYPSGNSLTCLHKPLKVMFDSCKKGVSVKVIKELAIYRD